MSSSYIKIVARVKEALERRPKINLAEIRELSFNGIPDCGGYRALTWKILLNYLPLSQDFWEASLSKQRAVYAEFVNEMIVKPGALARSSGSDVTFEDHPLNPNPDSQWAAYFKDNEILLQIDKDCRRLCPDISFFQQATEVPCEDMVNPDSGIDTLRKRVEQTVLDAQSVTRNRLGITNVLSKQKLIEEYYTLPDGQEAHWEVVERILFIFAKLNPGHGYVQGMNEIIGPLYYIFYTTPDKAWQCHAEADTFFCFTNLMSEIRDNFITTLDHHECGIGGLMDKLMDNVKRYDFELWLSLKRQGIQPQFFGFRWLTLLLSQEFDLPDLIRLWDTLLADSVRFDFLIDVCCAMMILVRDDLLKDEFTHTIKTLQNYPRDRDIVSIIQKALQLRQSSVK